jgi:hypothetical protein
MREDAKLLPLKVIVIDNRILVTKDLSAMGLSAGSEIKSING